MILLHNINSFERSSKLEWLETNGLGGYAMGTVSGAHTRRYHGILVAAMHPPVERMVVVSKWEESIIVQNQQFDLSSNQYPGAIFPQGFQHLTKFHRDLFPELYYEAGGVLLKKTIAMIHGEDTTVINYEVIKAPQAFEMEFLPLYACKDFHAEAHANPYIDPHYLFVDDVFRTFNYQGCPEFFIQVPGSTFLESRNWYYHFEHAIEQERGLDFQEDLFTHGKFIVKLKQGDTLGVVISLDDPAGKKASILLEKEIKRREKLVPKGKVDERLKVLRLAADQFIVKRGHHQTIIAGYPWFSDWGRDTMIALRGLCLSTGRWREAKSILKEFSLHFKDGMLPNRFPDHGETPEYNTMDATLWFFVAVYDYYQKSADDEFVQSLLPLLEDSIRWHYKGTHYQIKVDKKDELLSGGEPGVQLTWMDAKVGDWVVTPRIGKPVEINSLWYNALMIVSELYKSTDSKKSQTYLAKAQKVHKNFQVKFWNVDQQCLYDNIEQGKPIADIRPNQVFALSLPFPLIDQKRAKQIVNVIQKQLLTPRGLRSLSPEHQEYQPVYEGSILQRDGSYHQGTVWSFLLGPYIDALFYAHGEAAKVEANKVVSDFLSHLEEACVGSVSEIFDANYPHHSRGCAAQAWGVAEVLRVVEKYKLLN